MSREERTRDAHRDRGGRDRPARDSDRDGARIERDRGGSNRSRSPRRERGGRRSDNRYRSRSPTRGIDKGDRDSGRGGRGDRNGREDRTRNDNFHSREPPKGPRGGSSRNADYRPGGPVKVPTQPREDVKAEVEEAKDANMEDRIDRPTGMDDETWDMYQLMGFAGFKSTKETKVPGNDKNWGVRKEKELKARQYMNRQGGFNRPLSPSRDA